MNCAQYTHSWGTMPWTVPNTHTHGGPCHELCPIYTLMQHCAMNCTMPWTVPNTHTHAAPCHELFHACPELCPIHTLIQHHAMNCAQYTHSCSTMPWTVPCHELSPAHTLMQQGKLYGHQSATSYERTAQQFILTQLAIFFLVYLLNEMVCWCRRGGNHRIWRKSSRASSRKCLLIKPKISSPDKSPDKTWTHTPALVTDWESRHML